MSIFACHHKHLGPPRVTEAGTVANCATCSAVVAMRVDLTPDAEALEAKRTAALAWLGPNWVYASPANVDAELARLEASEERERRHADIVYRALARNQRARGE